MTDPSRQDSPESAGTGAPHLAQSATGVLGSILDYLHARVSLLSFEAKEARSDLLGRIVCLAICAFFLLIAYTALCVGVIGVLSHRYQWPWPIVTLGAAVLHAVIAVILFAIARRRFSQPPFRDSTREWERDRAWLDRHRNRPSSRS